MSHAPGGRPLRITRELPVPEALRRYEVPDRLPDGHPLIIRAIRPDDKQALVNGLHRLSPQAAYFRFFRPKPELSSNELVYFTEVDFRDHVALVAVLDDGQTLVGVGRYVVCDVEPIRSAEIAFTVDEAYRGRGVATLLLRHLAKIARAAGIDEFRASVLAGNRKMLAVLSRSGLPQESALKCGVVTIRIFLNVYS